jgi:arginase family enzyme
MEDVERFSWRGVGNEFINDLKKQHEYVHPSIDVDQFDEGVSFSKLCFYVVPNFSHLVLFH